MQSSFITLADMEPTMEALGKVSEFRAILDELRDSFITTGNVSDGLERLKLFAYSRGPTNESMEIIVTVWMWRKGIGLDKAKGPAFVRSGGDRLPTSNSALFISRA